MTELPGPAWELTKSFLFPPMVCFPDPVWGRIKGFAIDPCPRCGGMCARGVPCWRRDLVQFPYAMLNPYEYRRKWYHRRGLSPV